MGSSRDVRKEEICHSVNRELKFMEEFCNSEDGYMCITSREEKKSYFVKRAESMCCFCLFVSF